MNLLVTFILFALGIYPVSSQITPLQQVSPIQQPYSSTQACYSLEEGVKATLTKESVVEDCQDELAGKTFVRLRQGVRIINAKITEGKSNWGTCNKTGPTGYGALRKVGPLLPVGNLSDPAEFGDIFWEDLNHKRQNISDFILVLTKRDDKYHTFDVYVDETKKNDLPEFITNCQETGGFVPVLEGPATPTFPPQAISLTDMEFNKEGNQVFDKSGYEESYAKFEEELENAYFLRIEEKAKPDLVEQIGTLQKTIQGETRNYAVYFHAGIVYLVGMKEGLDTGISWMYNPTDTKPPLNTAKSNPTLQLAVMKFITTSEWTWATPECKPALYLYPERQTKLSIRVLPQGVITTSIPDHGEIGWFVTANPDGTIYNGNDKYPYLYYETELYAVEVPKEGWLVEKETLEYFFIDILPKLGLRKNEIKDFLAYWLPTLKTYLGSSTRLFVGLLPYQELNRVEPIVFSQEPETLIRIRFYFEKLNSTKSYLNIVSPDLSEVVPATSRKGFTVIDWGGIIAGGSCGLVEKAK